MKKVLTLVTILVMLSYTNILAQDPCQSYHDRYRVCVEKENAGREVDYTVCKNLSSSGQSACEAAGCAWYKNSPTQAFPCMLDICLSEVTGDDYIGAMDFAIFKREQGKSSCPCSP